MALAIAFLAPPRAIVCPAFGLAVYVFPHVCCLQRSDGFEYGIGSHVRFFPGANLTYRLYWRDTTTPVVVVFVLLLMKTASI